MSAVARAYHPVTKLFHWLMAVLIIGLLALGLTLDELPQVWKGTAYGLHKSFGVLVLLLAFGRALWWVTQRRPALVDSIPAWLKPLVRAGHDVLYVFMFLMPLSGILMSQSAGHPVAMFGWQVPTLVAKNTEMAGVFREVHEIAGFVLIALLVAHVAAAVVHHRYFRDETLVRMLPSHGKR
ncbi:MAG: cytochrome b [Pseudomonadaceae bacterium]|nr:cytochrome b [Pseudomonadaceae bacterium]